MELYFLDKDLNRLTFPIDRVKSLVWRMRFFECGTFRAVFPFDAKINLTAKEAEYLCSVYEGEIRCGRIDSVEITGEEVVVTGKMCECILRDRMIEGWFLMAGTVSNAVLSAVKENSRGLPLVVEEDPDAVDAVGIFSVEWENLSAWIYRVLRPYGASCSVELDPDGGAFVFRVVRHAVESGAVFSSSFGNGREGRYCCDSGLRKNKVYIEGADGKVVSLDGSNGAEVREVFRKAADLRADRFATMEDYTEALQTRAAEVLAEYGSQAELTCRVEDCDGMRFGKDYRLGDFCYAADEDMGVFAKARIAGVDESWENGGRSLSLRMSICE